MKNASFENNMVVVYLSRKTLNIYIIANLHEISDIPVFYKQPGCLGARRQFGQKFRQLDKQLEALNLLARSISLFLASFNRKIVKISPAPIFFLLIR